MANLPAPTLSMRWSIVLLVVSVGMLSSCSRSEQSSVDIVVTVPPLKMILEPLINGRMTIECVLPPGVSPHTFTLRPSTAHQLEQANTIFYVAPEVDGWAVRSDAEKATPILPMVPEALRLEMGLKSGHAKHHDEGGHPVHLINPHFWSDPHLVMAIIPKLVEILSELDPDGKAHYEANGIEFIAALKRLDSELITLTSGLDVLTLVSFHPSWSYFFHRYGLNEVASVEPIPGKEISAKSLMELQRSLDQAQHIVVLSEVQLPQKSAHVLAEALSARVVTIDPLGGEAPFLTYAAMLRENAMRLRAVLQ